MRFIRLRSRFSYILRTILVATAIFYCHSGDARVFRTIGFSTTNGMSDDRVNDVTQDRFGAIWFATRGGLLRFDGQEWVTTGSLSKRFDVDLARVEITGDDTIWVCSHRVRRGFAYSSNGGVDWKLIPGDESSDRVIYNFKVVGSRIFVATRTTGELLCCDNGVWTGVRDFGPGPRMVYDLQLVDDTLVVATSAGISLLRAGKWEHDFLDRFSGVGGPVYGVASNRGDVADLWFVQQGQLGRIVDGVFQVVAKDTVFRGGQGAVMVPDGCGGVCVGNYDGVLHFDAYDGLQPMGSSSGLIADGATAMLRDRDGNIWITNLRGVSCIPSMRFANLDKSSGLFAKEVATILESPPGRIVFGHVGGLSFLQDGKVSTLELPTGGFQLPNARRVLDMAADRTGTLWLAQKNVGVTCVKPDGEVHSYTHPDLNFSLCVCVDRNDQLWVGGDVGVYRLMGDELVRESSRDIPSDLAVRRIVELADGRICLATPRHGIYVSDGDAWQNVRHANLADANNVFSIAETPAGIILVGTAGGLFAKSGEQLTRYTIRDSVIDEEVYAIQTSKAGQYWFGTHRGVLRQDSSGLTRFRTEQGLIGNEINRAAFVFASNGTLWIGTPKGAANYRENYDFESLASLHSEILDVEVNGISVPFSSGLSLGYRDNNVTFQFRAAAFVPNGLVSYRARLNGFDSEWLTGSDVQNGVLRYTNLPPGAYRFEVQARKDESEWGSTTSTKAIAIQRPFWKTVWFNATLLLGGVFAGVVVIHVVSTHIQNKKLDDLVRLRTAELQAARDRYHGIFEKNRLPQLLIDLSEDVFIGVNQAALEFYDMTESQVIGQKTIVIFRNPEIESQIRKALEIESISFDAQQRDGRGGLRQIRFYACLYELQGRNIVQVSVFDVTEKHQLQEQLFQAQKMECLGRIAGGVAHDFNNLLTAVMTYAQVALESPKLPDAIRNYLYEINKAGKRGAGLTSQLLGFARKQTASPRATDVNTIISELDDILHRVVHEGIDIHMQLSDGSANVLIDPVQLEQVLVNLAVNASDAMGETGSLILETKLTSGADHRIDAAGALRGPHVVISVSDSGTGIDKSILEQVFEPFFTTKERGRGTGLGLSTCQGIVKQNHGEITIHSDAGFGTTVRVFLPLTENSVDNSTTHVPVAAQSGNETILLVEDDESLREIIAQSLRMAGYTVLTASSAASAVKVFHDNEARIDILITDVIMPGGSGAELYHKLAESRTELPVLFVSGYPCSALNSNGLNLEHLPLLEKPFVPNELMAKVRDVLAA